MTHVVFLSIVLHQRLPWQCGLQKHFWWWVPFSFDVVQGVPKKTWQWKEKAPRLKEERRRDHEQILVNSSLLLLCFFRVDLWQGILRRGAFSFPCPVYWRLFLGHPVPARTPLILSNVVSIVLYIVTTLVFRIPARTLIISVIHRHCEGITRHASHNTWCGSILAHH